MNPIKRKLKTIFKTPDEWASTAVTYAARGKTFQKEDDRKRFQECIANGRHWIEGNPTFRRGRLSSSLLPCIFDTLKSIDKKIDSIAIERIDSLKDAVLLIHPVCAIYGYGSYDKLSKRKQTVLEFLLGYADMRYRELHNMKLRIIL